MSGMFQLSKFHGKIKNWNVKNVIDMNCMFNNTGFEEDLINWQPYKLEKLAFMFENCISPIPYWSKFSDSESLIKSIHNYILYKKIDKKLPEKEMSIKKNKI